MRRKIKASCLVAFTNAQPMEVQGKCCFSWAHPSLFLRPITDAWLPLARPPLIHSAIFFAIKASLASQCDAKFQLPMVHLFQCNFEVQGSRELRQNQCFALCLKKMWEVKGGGYAPFYKFHFFANRVCFYFAIQRCIIRLQLCHAISSICSGMEQAFGHLGSRKWLPASSLASDPCVCDLPS